MRRRYARAGAVETLYQWDLMRDDPERLLTEVVARHELTATAAGYLQRIVGTTLANREQIDAMLTATLEKWKLSRLSYVDRAILRVGCCEILFFGDVPNVVSINEAVELAKLYGDDKSPAFINGVLDAIARHCVKPNPALSECR
jgi:N utilization substance protein B